MRFRDILFVLIVLSLLVSTFSVANAGPGKVGVRGGYFTDAEEVFLGGEFLTPVSPRLYFNPNAEYVFVDGGTFMTFNGDFHYDFPTSGRNFVWAGAGLGMSYLDPDGPSDSQTDLGLNLLFGIGLPSGNVIPYFQLKFMLGDVDDVVLGFGIRF